MRGPTRTAWLRGIILIVGLLMFVAFSAHAQQDTAWEPTDGVDDTIERASEEQYQASNNCGCPSCETDTDIVYTDTGFCKKWKVVWRRDLIHVNPANCDCIFGAWYVYSTECLEYR